MKHVYKFAAVLVAAGLAFAPSLRAGGSTSTTTLPYTSGAMTLDHPAAQTNCFQCHLSMATACLAGKSVDIAGI
jgi:hypothetical protein